MILLQHMHVGICKHCGEPVTEAQSWGHEGPDMGGYPPTVPVYHLSCQYEAALAALEVE